MSSSVNTILPEYTARFIPEGTKIELPFNESGKLSKEIDELTEDEFNMFKEEISVLAYTFLGIDKEYEAMMESPTYSGEAVAMNNKHVALVTNLAEKYGDSLPDVSVKEKRLAVIAAMLHDMEKNKIFTNEEERLLWHHIWSAQSAEEVLNISGLSAEDTGVVTQMIVEHQPMPFVASAFALGRNDPGHKWARAGEAVNKITSKSDNPTKYDQLIVDTWERGSLERPSSPGAAVLFSADLMAPSEIFDPEFFENFKLSGNSTLKEFLDSTGKPFQITEVAAGSFDRYVLANLRWGATLTDGFQSAYRSLYMNVAELGSESKNVDSEKEALTDEQYNSRVEAAKVMFTIADKYGVPALNRMNKVNSALSEALDVALEKEKELPVDDRILTNYQNTHYEIHSSTNLSEEEKKDKLAKLDSMRSAYITKSMYLLYSSALPVFAEE